MGHFLVCLADASCTKGLLSLASRFKVTLVIGFILLPFRVH